MKKICAYLVAAVGLVLTGVSSIGSHYWLFDEPKNSNFDD